jgi:hypothetical protein
VTVKPQVGEEVLALDIVLRRNDADWFEHLSAEIAPLSNESSITETFSAAFCIRIIL